MSQSLSPFEYHEPTARPFRSRRHLRRRLPFALAVVGAMVLGITSTAWAHGHGKMRDPAKKREFIQRTVEKELAPKLNLDRRGIEDLTGLLVDAHTKRGNAHQKVRAERQRLKEMLKGDATDAELDAQIDRIAAAAEAMPSKHALLKDTRRVLTPRQQAQLMIELPKVMKKRWRHHRAHKMERQHWKTAPDTQRGL